MTVIEQAGEDRIVTPRLELVLATRELLEADLAGPAELGAGLGASVPVPGWPAGLWDEDALRWSIRQFDERPGGFGRWGAWYWIRREDRLLVGAGGYKGPPDESGTVEFGYSVVEQLRRQGIASEASRALVENAFADSRVRRVIAETFPELVASLGVMRSVGMRPASDEPSEAGALRYELLRGAAG